MCVIYRGVVLSLEVKISGCLLSEGLLSVFSISLKAEYDKLIPGSKIKTALNEAERLSESLRERYTTPQGKRQKLDGVDQSQGEGVGDQQVPNDATDAQDKPKSAEEVYRRSTVSCNSL